MFLGALPSISQTIVLQRWGRFVFGIAMLVASFFLLGTGMLFMRGTKDYTLMNLAWLTLCLGSWQLEDSRVLQLFIGFQPLHWCLEYMTQLFLPFLSYLFLRSISEKKDDRIFNGFFCAITLVVALQLLLQVTSLAPLTRTIFLSHVLYVFMCGYSIVMIGRQQWIRQSKLKYLFLVSMLYSIGIFGFTFFSLLNDQFYSGAMSVGLAITFLTMKLLAYHKELRFFQQVSQAETYKELAFIDLATGTHNKTAWFTFMDDFNEKSPQGEYALILFDMNNLKKLNDECGHVVGDRVIKAFAYCLMEAVGKKGIVYRIGGDEFVCVCYNIPREDVMTILFHFEKSVECQKDSAHPFSAAYGYDFFTPRTTADFQKAFDRADEKMYEHKQKMKLGRK